MSMRVGDMVLETGEVIEARMPFDMGPRHEDVDTGPESEVQQQFVDECDINNIMKRYRVTGLIPQLQAEPMFGDFSNVADYQTALNAVIAADSAFEALPSDIRTRFENDPQKFLAFMDDAKNYDEIVKMGLTTPKTVSDVDRLIEAVEKIQAPAQPAPLEPAPSPK